MKKQLLSAACLALLTSACMEEKFETPVAPSGQGDASGVTSVTFIAEDFVFADESDTRSLADMSDLANIKFRWDSDDVIGIFPATETGDQISFPIEDISAESANVATVDGGGWALKNTLDYCAYYPFNKDNYDSNKMAGKIPFRYEGQTAVFEDTDHHVDIGDFDYMYSFKAKPDYGKVTLTFKHLGALARVNITSFPKAAAYTGFKISVTNGMFPVSGTYDLKGIRNEGDVVQINQDGKKTSSEINIGLNITVPNPSESKVLYFMLPPVDRISDSEPLTLTASLVDSDGNEYESAAVNISGNIIGGKAYGWKVSSYTDNLSQGETANCYIVSKAGTYKFEAVKGNSEESVGTLASVAPLALDGTEEAVLWETYGTATPPGKGDLVSDVKYSDGYIYFKASGKKGNASIAAKDDDGNILWSWHIWMTDKPEDQVYNKNAGTMMDRNLGAISATPGDVGALGLLYQWGRKDPFLNGSSNSYSGDANQNKAASTGVWSYVASNSSNGTISYATANPTIFITYNNSNEDWLYTGNGSVDNSRWQPEKKTIYDPCPPGYRVPEGGTKENGGVWAKAFDNSGDINENAYDAGNKGFNFGSLVTTKKLTTDYEICWYPASGCLRSSDFALCNVGFIGYYWSCTPSSYKAFSLYVYNTSQISPSSSGPRAYASSVRCFKIGSRQGSSN